MHILRIDYKTGQSAMFGFDSAEMAEAARRLIPLAKKGPGTASVVNIRDAQGHDALVVTDGIVMATIIDVESEVAAKLRASVIESEVRLALGLAQQGFSGQGAPLGAGLAQQNLDTPSIQRGAYGSVGPDGVPVRRRGGPASGFSM